jgi:CRISPR-associated protein Cmr2
MPDLLIVTLGPIQDFIAAARRSRDLWFGSWLLSELSKATAMAMAEECGLDALVFPGVSKLGELRPESTTSVANKIVVRVPGGKDAATVARQGEAGMKARLDFLRDQAFEKIKDADGFFLRDPARDQVNDLIEFAWVSAAERGPDGYSEARKEAEALLAARKNTRLWKPVSWGKPVPKSSIDGERESVLHEDLFNGVGKEGGLLPEEVRRRYGVGPTERLCGVGLLKRHGVREGSRYAHRFLSTGHLAAWPLYARTQEVRDPDLEMAWTRYLEILKKWGINLEEQQIVQGDGWSHLPLFDRYDGSLLFENRLAELFKEVVLDRELRQKGVQEAQTALAKVLEKIGVSTPIPYYAILQADGDRMGKAIERQETFQKHKELSRQLDLFAQAVRGIVERDHGGELIYSGGDDVLAFVPLHRAVPCARDLAKEFQKQLAKYPVDTEEKVLSSLSVGIGISHFMDPMRGALDLARRAEGLAKKERNSLAVIVDKRSGPPVEVVGTWGTLDVRLKDYVTIHRKDWVPDGAAYELRELSRLLERVSEEEKANLTDLVRKEAERILRRKQPGHGTEKEIHKKVMSRLLLDFDALPVSEVADRLIVSRLLAKAADEAGEKFESEDETSPSTTGGQP